MNNINELEKTIGYYFNDIQLLKRALTHSSYANEMKINKLGDYERLEFLGDAVLELVSSDYLFRKYENKEEGTLTKKRASMVCESSLAMCAKDFGLEHFILLGKGEDASGGRYKDSIVSDVCEALIGAIYLDSGFEQAKKFIDTFVLGDLEGKALFSDSKSSLQEYVQGTLKQKLEYVLLSEEGPEHDKMFEVSVTLDGEQLASGKGHTKKSAEQNAAYNSLILLGVTE